MVAEVNAGDEEETYRHCVTSTVNEKYSTTLITVDKAIYGVPRCRKIPVTTAASRILHEHPRAQRQAQSKA